jgi:hypothetical protein
MKFYSIFFLLNIFSACDEDKAVDNFTVIKFQKVTNGYQFSKDILKYQGNTYKPLVSANYIMDTLSNIDIYKSEGKVSYSIEDLQNDVLFKLTLDLPELRRIIVRENSLVDNYKTYHITEIKNDSIFCFNQDTLFLYIH